MGSWRVVVICILAGIVALSSCGQADSDPPATQNIESILSSYETYVEARHRLFATDEDLFRAIEEGISVCMQEGGFDYVPFPEQYTWESAPTDTPSSDSLESSLLRTPQGPADPNEAIMAALDSPTRSAYVRRLWGTSDEISDTLPEGGVSSMDLTVEAIGCQNFVGIELTGGASAYEDDTWLLEFSSALEERVKSHERFIAAEQAFDRCLAETDYLVALGDFDEASTAVSLMDPADDPSAFEDAMSQLRDLERQVSIAEDSCTGSSDVKAVAEQLRSELFDQVVVEEFG